VTQTSVDHFDLPGPVVIGQRSRPQPATLDPQDVVAGGVPGAMLRPRRGPAKGGGDWGLVQGLRPLCVRPFAAR